MVSGYQCHPTNGCGKWIEKEIVPVIPMPKIETVYRKPLPPRAPVVNPNFATVQAERSRIEAWLAEGRGWPYITKELGLTCHEQTTRKQYNKLNEPVEVPRARQYNPTREYFQANRERIHEIRVTGMPYAEIIEVLKLNICASSLSRYYSEHYGASDRAIWYQKKKQFKQQQPIIFGRGIA